MLIKIANGIPQNYSFAALRRDEAASFPPDISEQSLLDYDVHRVQVTSPPSYDATTERLNSASPVLVNGVWQQTWSVVPIPIEQQREIMVASPAQIKVTLHILGLLGVVQAIVDADPIAKIIWDEATEIERTNPLIDALGGDGFTPEQIDDVFRYAMNYKV